MRQQFISTDIRLYNKGQRKKQKQHQHMQAILLRADTVVSPKSNKRASSKHASPANTIAGSTDPSSHLHTINGDQENLDEKGDGPGTPLASSYLSSLIYIVL